MPEKPQALTIVFNPNARKPRLKPPSFDAIGAIARVHVTQNLDELDKLMSSWSDEVETVCFYGGDGSIARGLTSLVRHQGENAVIPPVLPVRAGTINMLCSILGFRESVEKTLERWARGQLTTQRAIPMIKVEVEGLPPQYGFVFAWGVGYRVLSEYYARKALPDVWDGLVVAANTFARALHPKAQTMPLFRAEDIKLILDGKQKTGLLRALTVGTIPRVSLGIRPFAPEPVNPGRFHVAANGMSLGRVFLHSPKLLFGQGDQRTLEPRLPGQVITGTNVSELVCELGEGYTMDGEMFELSGRTRVRISPGPMVRFWTLAQ